MPINNSSEVPGTRTYRRVFPGRSDQISEVRHFIRDHLADHPSAPEVALVASELTTNAYEHTDSGCEGGTFTVCAELRTDDTVRLEVTDDGGPTAFGLTTYSKEGGRGLDIVNALTVEWDVEGDASGRTIRAVFKP